MNTNTDVAMQPLKTLIRLCAAGARREALPMLQVDWPSVMPLAAEQGVIPLVALSVMHSPDLGCTDKLHEFLIDTLRVECSKNMLRRQRVLHLLAEMRSFGIESRLLKGYAVADNYAIPESRSSVDTDLLINIQQEKKAIQFLEERGFRITPRVATSQHSVCQHKKYGEIELHVALYAELIRDIWFKGMDTATLAQEEPISVDTPDGTYTTLGNTDHLIFITLHMVKHFIMGGLTLRMMLDIALLFARNRDKIDAARFWSTMNRLRYTQLVNCVLWIMIRYGGFQLADFTGCASEAPEQVALLLNDLLQGGYMGERETEERYASGMEYNRRILRKSKSAVGYRLYMLRFKVRSAIGHMFPARKHLREMYPHTGTHNVMVPFLYLAQIISFPIKKVCSGALKRDIPSDSKHLSSETQKRVDMFQKLDML